MPTTKLNLFDPATDDGTQDIKQKLSDNFKALDNAHPDNKSTLDKITQTGNETSFDLSGLANKNRLNDLAINVKDYEAVGDGVTDDTVALQNALTAGQGKTVFIPDGTYIRSDSLTLPSNIELVLSHNAVIKAADATNKPLFINDYTNGVTNVRVTGGTLDGNAINQSGDTLTYQTSAFWMKNVNGLHISNITIKNTHSLGMNLGDVHNFIIENVRLDQDNNSPNQDGVHICGPATNGTIRNISGVTYDDMVAINADDKTGALSMGDVKNILVDNVQSQNCYRAVRLLSVTSIVDKVTIQNINCECTNGYIEIGHFGLSGGTGNFKRIKLQNLIGTPDASNGMVKISGNIAELDIENVKRNDDLASPTVYVAADYVVKHLRLFNFNIIENKTDGATQFILDGIIDTLQIDNMYVEKQSGDTLRTFLFRGQVLHGVINNVTQIGGNKLFEFAGSNATVVFNYFTFSNITTKDVAKLIRSMNSIDSIHLSNVIFNGGEYAIDFNYSGANTRLKVTNFDCRNTLHGGRADTKRDFLFNSGSLVSIDGDMTVNDLPTSPLLYDRFIFTKTDHATLNKGLVFYNGINFVNMLDGSVA